MRRIHTLLLASTVFLSLPVAARAQAIKGPTTCFKCHKPLAKQVWEVDAAFHKKSVDQLSAPKAAAFAAAIGLASPTTVTGKPGDCVSCHATVVAGAPSVGVSCETCHGPASGYYAPHQEPEFYTKPESQWLGLKDLYNKPAAIAALCVNCHVTPDPRLKKAGHPAGETFDAGKSIQKMVHWDSGMSTNRKRAGYGPALYASIGAESPKLVAKRIAQAGPAVAAAAPAGGPPPAAAAPNKPAAGGAAPAVGGTAPNAGAPAAGSAATKPKGGGPAKPADPFDWDQPVQELPKDYPSDNGGAAAAPTGPAPKPAAPGPKPAVTAPSRPAAQAPSTAAEVPSIPEPPVVTPTAPAAVAAPSNAAGAPAGPAARPTQPSGQVAELRGRSAAVLASLLKQKRGALPIPAPAAPVEFDGPDGELLRLQDEILYLALDALRKPQQ